jgi:hypothetical protein
VPSVDQLGSAFGDFSDELAWQTCLDGLDQLRSEHEVEERLNLIEFRLSTFHAAPQAPYFHIAPPTLLPPEDWWPLLRDFPIDEATGRRLLASGFMPFDRERFVRRTRDDPWHAMSPERRFMYLDLDYGVLIFDGERGFDYGVLDYEEHQRYLKHYKGMRNGSDVLALGQHRAAQLYAVAGERPVYECEVASRSELDEAVGRLEAGMRKFPNYEMWFRGQTSDYLLGDLTAEAARGICPWRSVRDSSLVPSLYRPSALPGRHGDWREYCAYGVEVGRLASFANRRFGIPRLGDDERNPAFRSIQGSFFLQHYGLPSTILDITRDLDIALFFAQYRIESGRRVPVDFGQQKPVIYAFLLRKGLDLFLDSAELLEGRDLLRPLRQQCGLIAGASFATRNTYAKFIALKIHLAAPIDDASYPVEYMYPGRDEDGFLRDLVRYQEGARLTRLRPYEPGHTD